MGEPKQYDNHSAVLPSAQALRRLASAKRFRLRPVSGHHFTVNETGLEILRRCKKKRYPECSTLSQEYSVGGRELERDMVEFAGMLRKFVGDYRRMLEDTHGRDHRHECQARQPPSRA